MNQVWSTVVTNWQGVDDEPTAGSKNLVESGPVFTLKETVNQQKKCITDILGDFFYTEHNGYLNSSGNYVGISGYHSKTTEKIECTTGDKFYYKGRGGINAVSALFYNNNSIIGSFYIESLTVFYEITIPENCNGVVFSSFSENNQAVVLSISQQINVPYRLDNIEKLQILDEQHITQIKENNELFYKSLHSGILTSNGTYIGGDNYYSYVSEKIKCSEGDIFEYKGVSGGGGNAVSALFYDSQDNIIGNTKVSSVNDYANITIPANCTGVVFASYSTSDESIVFDVIKIGSKPYEISTIGNILSVLRIEKTYEIVGFVDSSGTINSTTSNYHSLITDYIECNAGDVFKYKGSASGSVSSAVFYDASKDILGVSHTYSTQNYVDIVTPTSCKFVRFASYGGITQSLVLNVGKSGGMLFDYENFKSEIKDVIGLYDYIPKAGYLNSSGSYISASNYKSLSTYKIPCNAGDVFKYKGSASTNPVSALFYNNNTIIGNSHKSSLSEFIDIIIPENCNYVIFSSYAAINETVSLQVGKNGEIITDINNINDKIKVIDTLKPQIGAYYYTEHNGYLNSVGGYSNTSNYHCYISEKIPCNDGDVFSFKGHATANSVSALFYNDDEIIGNSHNTSAGSKFVDIQIPANCNNVVFSSYAAIGSNITLSVYKKGIVSCGRVEHLDNSVYRFPLTDMPKYILDNLAYKPLGSLDRPYICLVTDDGAIEMNTYTIPMILSKGVPMTFAIMSTSAVMQTQEDIAIVKNAISNGGCSVAQHGGYTWDNYDEYDLNSFFDREKAFFDNLEIDVKGAVIPAHVGSNLISAVAGGRFGVVRSGYNGHGSKTIHYDYYTAGARSNLFLLPSYNIIDYSLETNKQALEYAISNNKLLIIYIHDNAMTPEYKTRFEDFIDYAKTRPITFITLGDIIGLT